MRLALVVRLPGDLSDGRSGVILIGSAEEAFSAGLALAATAEQTIDAQCYPLHKKLVGQIFAWNGYS